MLALERKEGQSIEINFEGRIVKVMVVKVKGSGRVRLAFDAPMDVKILREELKKEGVAS